MLTFDKLTVILVKIYLDVFVFSLLKYAIAIKCSIISFKSNVIKIVQIMQADWLVLSHFHPTKSGPLCKEFGHPSAKMIEMSLFNEL